MDRRNKAILAAGEGPRTAWSPKPIPPRHRHVRCAKQRQLASQPAPKTQQKGGVVGVQKAHGEAGKAGLSGRLDAPAVASEAHPLQKYRAWEPCSFEKWVKSRRAKDDEKGH